ncbi:MAG TPA: ribosome biogenesis GTP-binding protein YihA/YsxC [Candidatus Acidoferrum sp.]|nr:ribosome biogenesis GTP-binding protein YihA/YsxC [Candidatus Acidoferrum sp.]
MAPNSREATRRTPSRGTRTTKTQLPSTRFIGSYFELGQIPQDTRPQVALAGRSNVGKSSLLNRLVGQKKLAKVSSTPGKTRSLNFFLINDRYYLVDLPGYGYAKVSRSVKDTWGKMIEDYLLHGENLAGLVLLLDCRRDAGEDDLKLLHWLSERQLPALIVVTKADKINRSELNRKVNQIERDLGIPAIGFSTVSGQGRQELLAAVHDLVTSNAKR